MKRLSVLCVAAVLSTLACATTLLPTAVDQALELAVRVDRSNTPAALASGEARTVSLVLTNAGRRTWSIAGDRPVRVSYHWKGPSPVWDGERTDLPAEVVPGNSVDVVARLVAPVETGSYMLVWDLVEEGVGWFGPEAGATAVPVEVRVPEARAKWDEVRPAATLHADVLATVPVKVRNAGTVAWPASGPGAVALSYHWRDPAGNPVVWDGERTRLQDRVLPGELIETNLRILPPPRSGRYILEVDLVRDALGWLGATHQVMVDVALPSLSAALELRQAPARTAVGQPIDLRLLLRNTGRAPWPNGGARRVRLAYHVTAPDGRVLLWDGPRTDIPGTIGPGESLELTPVVRAPVEPGRYKFTFDLLQEGLGWWFAQRGNVPVDVYVEVVPLDFAAYFEKVDAVSPMAIGLRYTVRAAVVNVGNVAWPKGGFAPVKLGYHWLDELGRTVLWDSPRAELEKDVAPGERASLAFELSPPSVAGRYQLVLDMVQEGIAWFSEKGTQPGRAQILVAEPSFRLSWRAVQMPERLTAGSIGQARLSVRNDGLFAWAATGEQSVHVGHHWRDPDGGLLVWDGFRTDLPREVEPGETVDLQAWLFAPASPGRYLLELDLVHEAVTWFAERGNAPVQRVVEVVQ